MPRTTKGRTSPVSSRGRGGRDVGASTSLFVSLQFAMFVSLFRGDWSRDDARALPLISGGPSSSAGGGERFRIPARGLFFTSRRDLRDNTNDDSCILYSRLFRARWLGHQTSETCTKANLIKCRVCEHIYSCLEPEIHPSLSRQSLSDGNYSRRLSDNIFYKFLKKYFYKFL